MRAMPNSRYWVCSSGLQAHYEDDQFRPHHASTCHCVCECCPSHIQRSWQQIIEGAHQLFLWLPPKNRGFFLAASAAKFWNRDFSSVSENAFPGILGVFLFLLFSPKQGVSAYINWHLGSLTAANWVSFDFNVSYSSCWGYSLINTFKFKKKNCCDM